MIKVMIAEDSPVMQQLLEYIFNSDPELKVVGIARDGEAAVKMACELKPDIITMDIYMPKMNGIEATSKIMEVCPTPIVIVSGNTAVKEVNFIFNLIEAGALSVALRPPSVSDPGHKNAAKELIQTIKLMSEIKVVRRLSYKMEYFKAPKDDSAALPASSKIEVIAIGASTGGPSVLKTILSGLPYDFPVPIMIVQHIAAGFTEGFSEWLRDSCRFRVKMALQGEKILPGQAYIAPDNLHMGLGKELKIILENKPAENGLRPSIDYLFRTVVRSAGKNAVGILLTGMGKDGANGLKEIHTAGAVTIVQDEESSVVYSMPGEARKLDAVTNVLTPEDIVKYLAGLRCA